MSLSCPSCFRDYAIRSAPFRCGNLERDCERVPDEKFAAAWGISTSLGRVVQPKWSAVVPTVVNCDRCQYKCIVRLCPNCHADLPTEAGQVPDRIYAVIGATDAGKSHYIAALISRLRTISQDLGFVFNAASKDTLERYDTDFKAYLDARRTIPITESGSSTGASVRRPLMYTLGPTPDGAERIKGKIHMVFYDMAGEDTTSVDRLNLVARYTLKAAGIIFLIDPLQLEGVRRRVSPGLHPHPIPTVSRGIEQVTQLLRSRSRSTARLKVPLAVALTKLDVIQPLLGPWSTLRHDAVHQDVPDRTFGFNADRELRAHLREWGEDWVLHGAEADYAQNRFFGVSALGAPPRSGQLTAEPLPRRVEDPLLWLLQQDGILARGKPI